jgi:hypothetical protein
LLFRHPTVESGKRLLFALLELPPMNNHNNIRRRRTVPLLDPPPTPRDWVDLSLKAIVGLCVFGGVAGILMLIGVVVGKRLGWF